MAALTWRLGALLCSAGFTMIVSAGWINITAEPGQNVTLPCRGSDHRTIIVVEWSRTDLGSEYVLRYRDQQLDPENQNPSFRNRVDLLDPQMKAGDVSVVLKNLTTDDRGTYECRVVQRGTRRRKRGSLKTRPVSSMVLDVVPSGSEDESREDGSVGLLVGLPVSIIAAAAAAAVAVGLIIYKRPGCLQQLYGPPAHQSAPEH